MHTSPTLRRTLVALIALAAGIAVAVPISSAGAVTPIGQPAVVLLRAKLVVSTVQVTDETNKNAPLVITHPINCPGLGAPCTPEWKSPNPYTYFNPVAIHAHDMVNVCAAVNNTGLAASLATTMSVTGPGYNAVVRVPPVAVGKQANVCTGAYSLDFGPYVGNCAQIILTATVGTSSKTAPPFYQNCVDYF